jgi:hypothetical protein
MFEIDPITGLPIIDPTTGKPKIKQPTFKSNKEAKAYFAQDQQNKFDTLAGLLGVNQPSGIQTGIERQREREQFEEQTGLNPDEYLSTEYAGPQDVSAIQPFATEYDQEAIEQMNLLEEKFGIAPPVGADYEDLLAEQQSNADQIANGLVKFAGKTAINVAGTLGNMIYGTAAALGDQKFSSFYDNQYMNLMNELEENLNSAVPNYVRKEVEDYSLLGQMGTTNFWANDVLGGLSFVAGALLSEYITAGLATPLQLSKLAKVLKYTDEAGNVLKGVKTAGALQAGDDLLRFGRQLATGTAYEAGIEANHFVKDAKDKFIADFVRINGREPDETEMALAMDDIYSAGNLVFGANAALVSASNMATLPNTFGPKLFNRLTPKLDDAAGKGIKYSELSPDDINKLAKKRGITPQQMIEEVKANPNKIASKYDLYSKPRNVFEYSKNFVKGPGAEMGEELGQSLIGDTALEHVASKWDEDGTETVTGYTEAFSKSLADSLGDKNFWKEGVIGLIIGSVGGPNVGRKKGEPLMQGGIWELGDKQKRAGVQSLINEINANPNAAPLTKEMVLTGIKNTAAAKELDKAASLGDMFRAKNKENEMFYNTAAAWHRIGRIDDFQKDTVESIEKMSNEEFKDTFEYINMDDAEISQRKKEVIEATKQRIQEVKDSMREASRVIDPKDRDLHDAFAFSLSTIKGLDRREASIAETLRDKVGILPQSNDLKDLIKYGLKVQDTDNLKRYEELTQQINNLRKNDKYKNLKRALTAKEAEAVENNEKQIERLEAERANALDKLLTIAERGEQFKKYDNDVDAFGQDLDLFRNIQKEIYDRVGVQQPEIKDAWEDLKKIAKYREQLISEYNFLLTKEGKKKFYENLDDWSDLIKKDRLSQEAKIAAVKLAADQELTYNKIMQFALRDNRIKAINPGVEDIPLTDPEVPSNEVKEAEIDAEKETVDDLVEASLIGDIFTVYPMLKDNLQRFANQWKEVLDNYNETKSYPALVASSAALKIKIEEILQQVTPENFEGIETDPYTNGLTGIIQKIDLFLNQEKTRQKTNKQTKDIVNPGTLVVYPASLGMVYTNFFKEEGNEAELSEAMNYLESTPIDEIANNIEVELSYYKEGSTVSNTKNPAVTVTKGFGGKKVQAVFYVNKGGKKIKIGAVPDLRRFKINGKDFNPYYPDHLNALNPSFVYKEGDQYQFTAEAKAVQNIYEKLSNLYKELDAKALEVTETNSVKVSNEKLSPLISLSRAPNIIQNLFGKTLKDVTSQDLIEAEYTDIEKGQAVKKIFKGHVVVFHSTKGRDFYIKKEGSNAWEKATDEIEGLVPIIDSAKAQSNLDRLSGYYFIQPFKTVRKVKGVEFSGMQTGHRLLSMKYPVAKMTAENESEFMNSFLITVQKAQELAAKLKAEYNNPDSPFYQKNKQLAEATTETQKASIKNQLNTLRREFFAENNIDSGIPGFFIPLTQTVGAIEYPITAYFDIKPTLKGEETQITFNIKDYRNKEGNIVSLKDKKGEREVYIRLNIKDITEEGISVQVGTKATDLATVKSSSELVDVLNNALRSYGAADAAGTKVKLPSITNILKATDPELGNFGDLEFNRILNPFNISLVDNSEYSPKTKKPSTKTPSTKEVVQTQGPITLTSTETTLPGRSLFLSEEEAEAALAEAAQTGQQPTPVSTDANVERIEIPRYFTFNELGGGKGKSGKAMSSVEADRNQEIEENFKKQLKEGDKLIEPNGTITYFKNGKVVKKDGSLYGMVDIPAFINGVTIERSKGVSTDAKTEIGNRLGQQLIDEYREELKKASISETAVELGLAGLFGTDLEVATKIRERLDVKYKKLYDAELDASEQQPATEEFTLPKDTGPVNPQQVYERARKVRSIFDAYEGTLSTNSPRTAKRKAEYEILESEFKKDFPGVDWKQVIKDNESDIEAFSFETESEQRDLQEAINNLKGILPKEISIKDISEIAYKLKTNGIPAGVVINASMYLNKFRKKGVDFHEAFHIVFRNFLTDNQIKYYLAAAKAKYGVPSKQTMEAFKAQVAERNLMSDKRLYEEWLEEQLADGFMGYMKNPAKPKNLLERLWEKIKNLVNFFSKKDAEEAINTLFDQIANGKYANARFVSNKFSGTPQSAYKLLFTAEYKLSPEQSVRTINTITRLVYNNLNTLTEKTDEALDSLIDSMKEEFIDKYLYASAEYFTSDLQQEQLNAFERILDNKENVAKIKEEVKKNLKYYSLPDYTEESGDPYSEVDDQELPENSWDVDISQVGGFNSLSKKAKNYLATVSTSYDPFNILRENRESLTEEAEFLNWGSNPVQLHTALTNLLKNSPKKDFIKRIEKSARYNPLLASFYRKFVSDIATELNQPVINSDTPIEVLSESMVYNTIAAAYEKVQAQYAVALMDQKKGLVKVFKSDSNDSARKQVTEWENRFLSSEARISKSQNVQNILKLKEILSTSKKYIASDETLADTIQEVSDIFNSLGIKLSLGYIRMSLLQNASEIIQSQIEYKRFEEFLNELDLFSEFIGFSVEDIEGLQVSLEKSNNPFTIDKDGTDTAARGRLIKMANYNATFDETVEETTFRNAENKTIYKIIASNYYFSEINKWGTHKRKELVKRLFFGDLSGDNVTEEAKIDAIYQVLWEEDNYALKDEAEGLWAQIKYNSLLKGLKSDPESKEIIESPENSEEFLSNLTLFILDGMRKVSLVKEGDNLIEEDFKDSEASVFAKSSDRDKLFMTMAIFGKGEALTEGKQSNFLRKTIERLKGGKALKDSTEVTLYRNEIIEAKKTQVAIQAPVQTLIDGKSNLNELAKERFLNILRTELDQIRDARKKSKLIQEGQLSTDGLTKNYYFTVAKLDGQSIEIFGNEYNLVYRVQGTTDIQNFTSDSTQKVLEQNNKKSIEEIVPKSEQLFAFKDLKTFNESLYRAIIEEKNGKEVELDVELLRDSIGAFAEYQFAAFIDYLKLPEIGLIKDKPVEKEVEVTDEEGNKVKTKVTENVLEDAGLPNYFKDGNTVLLNNLKEFYFNDYFTSAEIGQLVHGPMARLYKDAVDVVKRNARMIASGPTIGNTSTTIVVKPSVKLKDRTDKSDSKLGRAADNIDTTDAQVFAHPLYRLKKYLPSLGKNDAETVKAVKDIIKGKTLTSAQNKHLKKTKNTSRPLKLVGSGRMFYLKCSVADIERGEVSTLVSDEKAAAVLSKATLLVARQEQADIRSRKAEKEQDASKKVQTVSLARAASDYLYDKFIEGRATQEDINELHSLWEAIPSKEYQHNELNEMEQKGALMVAYDSAIKVDNKLGTLTIPDSYIREQVETSNLKDELVHGTQLMNLIWSEQKDDTIVTLKDRLDAKGNPVTVTLGELREAYKKQLADRNYKGLEKFLNLIRTKVNVKGTSAKVINYEVLLELLNESLDISNPDPYMKELLKGIQSPESTDLILPEYNLNLGIIVNKVAEMYMSLASKSALKHKVAGSKLTLKSDIGENVMESDGKIITPQEYRKNPDKYRNKVATRRLAWRVEKNGEIYTEIKISAQTAAQYKLGIGDNIPQHLLEVLGVRIPTQDKHSMVYAKIVEFLPEHTGNIVVMPAEVVLLSGADFDVDSLFARLYPTWGKENKKYGDYKNIQDAFDQWIYSTLKSKEGKRAIKKFNESDIIEAGTEKAIFENLSNEVALLKESGADEDVIDELYKDAIIKLIESTEDVKAILKFMGVPSTVEEFESKYGNTVKKNIRAYEEGNLAAVDALTKEEIDTILFDIEKHFVYNTSNADINSTPASVEIFDEVSKEHAAVGIEDKSKPNAVHDAVNKSKSDSANSTGKENIGPAAVFNVVFQRLSEYKTALRKGDIFGSTQFVGKNSDGKILNFENKRINDLISSVVSAMTDNAKDPKAAEFNLTFDIISPILVMIGKGISDKSALTLSKLPVIKKTGQLVISGDRFPKAVNAALQETILPLKEGDIDIDEDDMITIEGNLQNYFLPALQYSRGNSGPLTDIFGGKAKSAYNYISTKAAENILTAKKAYESVATLSSIMSLSKGMKPSFADDAVLDNMLNDAGLEVVLKDTNSDPFNPHSYIIRHTEDFKADTKGNKFMYDLLPIVNGDIAIKSMLQVRAVINHIAAEVFISKSKDFKELTNLIKQNSSVWFLRGKDNLKNINDSLISYISMMAKNAMSKYSKLPLSVMYEGEKDSAFKRKVGTIEKAVKSLQLENPEFRDNVLLNSLEFTSSETKAKNSPYKGVEIIRIALNTDLKGKHEFSNLLRDASLQLMKSPNPKAKEVLRMIVQFSDLKESGMFRNRSILKALDPKVALKNQSDALYKAHSLMQDLSSLFKRTVTYQSLFDGMSKADFYRESLFKFLLANKNKMAVPLVNAVEATAIINNVVQNTLKGTKIGEEFAELKELLKDKDLTDEQKNALQKFFKDFKVFDFIIGDEGLKEFTVSTYIGATQTTKDGKNKYNLDSKEKAIILATIKSTLENFGFPKVGNKLGFPAVITVDYMYYDKTEEISTPVKALLKLKEVKNYTGTGSPETKTADTHDFTKEPIITGNIATYEPVEFVGISDFMAAGYSIKELMTDANEAKNFVESTASGVTNEEQDNTVSKVPNEAVSTAQIQTPIQNKSLEPGTLSDEEIQKRLDTVEEFLLEIYGNKIITDKKTVTDPNSTESGIYYVYPKEVQIKTEDGFEDASPILTIAALSNEGLQGVSSSDYVEGPVAIKDFTSIVAQGRVKMLPLTSNQATELKQKLCS